MYPSTKCAQFLQATNHNAGRLKIFKILLKILTENQSCLNQTNSEALFILDRFLV